MLQLFPFYLLLLFMYNYFMYSIYIWYVYGSEVYSYKVLWRVCLCVRVCVFWGYVFKVLQYTNRDVGCHSVCKCVVCEG